jgi:hypothetical protein
MKPVIASFFDACFLKLGLGVVCYELNFFLKQKDTIAITTFLTKHK